MKNIRSELLLMIDDSKDPTIQKVIKLCNCRQAEREVFCLEVNCCAKIVTVFRIMLRVTSTDNDE
jgi:hypothetical protein